MTDFEVKVIKNYGTDSDKLIGCDVVLYDSTDKIETITIMNASQAQNLVDKIDTLDGAYLTLDQLREFCSNATQSNEINANKFNGLSSDKFSKDGHTHSYLEKTHADLRGGTGTYGHVQIVDNLTTTDVTGKALSAKQGKVLNDKINNLTVIEEKDLHSKWKLIRYGNVVNLIVNGYKFGTRQTGDYYDPIHLIIPAPFKPVASTFVDSNGVTQPSKIYLHNQHDKPRVRLNTGTCDIEVMFGVGTVSEGQQVDGSLTYICDPTRTE